MKMISPGPLKENPTSRITHQKRKASMIEDLIKKNSGTTNSLAFAQSMNSKLSMTESFYLFNYSLSIQFLKLVIQF